MKYSELVRRNRELGVRLQGSAYPIAILSNITTNALHAPLEYALRSLGINAQVRAADFDNIVQSSFEQSEARAVLIFWDLIRFSFDQQTPDRFLEDIKHQIDLIFKNLGRVPLVIFNKFSAECVRADARYESFREIAAKLNEYLLSSSPVNVYLVDLDEIISQLKPEKSFNWRDFETFSSLYSRDFFGDYVSVVSPALLSMNGYTKKILVTDCDGTLWGGVVGEDGLESIELGDSSENGRVFVEVQKTILTLKKKGILFGVCSKNNPVDVESVFERHPQTLLAWKDVDISRVNWSDKVTNLRDMARELNISLDSFVYLDDSPYELTYIRENLPEVTVFEVPRDIGCYPALMRKVSLQFWSPRVTDEDRSRGLMMATERHRLQEQSKFSNLPDYLSYLRLQLKIEINPTQWISRLSQLTQKTNQFNSTTRRISEAEFSDILKRSDYRVYAFEASDRFGDYGVTGLAIVRRDRGFAELESFLMSCRTLGRDFEKAFFDFIVRDLISLGIQTLNCLYKKTAKNMPLASFFDALNFDRIVGDNLKKTYVFELETYSSQPFDHVAVTAPDHHV